MKWETMPRGYLMPHAHTDTNQPASNPESPTLARGEGIPVCLNTGAHFSSPKHLTTHCCLPKQVVAILRLFGLPQLNIR